MHAVETEPPLQPLDGEVFEYKSANKDDDARVISNVWDFGASCDRRFLMLRWSHLMPEAIATCPSLVSSSQQKKSKSLEYGERILNVEHGDSILSFSLPPARWLLNVREFSEG